MVAFTTLFLGLVLGPQTVGVIVGDQVSVVEIFVDGESCGTVRDEPFQLRCEFGDDLSPHHLVAVAADSEGDELGRAEQWVNLPRQPAETTIALTQDPSGRSTVARLSWESLGASPSEIRVQLDGQPIEVEDPSRIPLPPYDPDALHLLQVEVDFDTLISTAEVVFGGTYGDEVTTKITALPIAHEKKRLPDASEMAGWFVKRGELLDVAAVDRGAIDLVVVRDLEAQPDLLRIWRGASNRVRAVRAAEPSDADPEGQRRIEFLWPVSTRRGEGASSVDLFHHSRKYAGRSVRLAPLLLGVQPAVQTGKQRLADALAVAGVTAAAGNNRRAVLLVVAKDAADESDLSAEQARGYLERLAVPLEVWAVAEDAAAPAAWGAAVGVSNYPRLEGASRRLFKGLERQSVVWLEGDHLPNEIELSELAQGIRIAGRAKAAE